jgi:hypothetical protein
MDHSEAISVFEDIQARPFNVSLVSGEPSNNCYFKGIELLQRLGEMGYAVRGRCGESYWDEKIFGKEITNLIPEDLMTTHFYTEIYLNDKWNILDPSVQPSLEKYGFTIGSWENGKSCFPITKLYTQSEYQKYRKEWFNDDYQKDFFDRGLPLRKALNEWFASRED